MAKIKLSAVVSEMRGKLNGSVFSKNRGGAYVRNKVTPVNPQTTSQGNVRSKLTALSQGWRSLTETQRNAWNTAVSNFTGTDIFGDIKTPSGINLYTKINLNLANAGQSQLNLPPLPGSVGVFNSLTITATATTPALTVAFTQTGVAAGQTVIVEATTQLSAGKNFVKSEFRKIGTFTGGTATPYNALAAYTAKFGTLVAGQKIFIRFKAISNTTGQAGQYTTNSVIVG
jgi:hypothetical protein